MVPRNLSQFLLKILFSGSKEEGSLDGSKKDLSDESLKLSAGSNRPNSLCSDSEHTTRWIDIVTLPLMMAYVTRYIFGTDKLRPNAFEVRGLNGGSTGIIHCDDSAILSQWLKIITDNIIGLTHLQVSIVDCRNIQKQNLLNRLKFFSDEVI